MPLVKKRKKSQTEVIFKLLKRNKTMTCTQIAVNLANRCDNVSGNLLRLCREGRLKRLSGFGPRNGFGYSLTNKFEHLMMYSKIGPPFQVRECRPFGINYD